MPETFMMFTGDLEFVDMFIYEPLSNNTSRQFWEKKRLGYFTWRTDGCIHVCVKKTSSKGNDFLGWQLLSPTDPHYPAIQALASLV